MTANLKNQKRFLALTPKEIDWEVNAVFTALTQDLDRPFKAGGRNVRSVVRKWCPLMQDTLEVDVDTFRRNYISAHFFDRYLYAEEDASCRSLEERALGKFKENLARGYCQNNVFLKNLQYGRLNSVLESAKLEIQSLLGELELEDWFPLCAHGPNATLGVKKENSYADKKAQALDGTLPAIALHKEYLRWNNHLGAYLEPMLNGKTIEYECVSGSKLSFVPKKFDSLRTMMIEPTINQFFQQGLGRLISKRLKERGDIDLDNQADVHRDLVRLITANNLDIATIDWSQASDRIWLSLVQRLLPSDWFAAIQDVRSPYCSYKGPGDKLPSMYEITMCGSMGCGFTFPLQTLVFLCVIRALAREGGHSEFVSVFGDDCICDSSLREDIEWFAGEVDWKLNSDKSFFDGPFRESCGVDSYRGEDCRPFFIQRPPLSDLSRATSLEAWAYGVFNLIGQRTGRGADMPYVQSWLLAFLHRLGVDEGPCLVPDRFSVKAGVQIKSLDSIPPLWRTHVAILEGFFYPYNGFHFQYLGSPVKKQEVDQEPYYLLALEGKGVPTSFWTKERDPEEQGELFLLNAGEVPSKEVTSIKRKTGYVHSWTYSPTC